MKVHVNGLDMYLEDLGPRTGRPIVLIHGFPFSHEMWIPQISLLTKSYRVIAYDVRGLGKSSVGDAQYTFEYLVDDLIGLLDRLDIEKAVLCGLSMGGYIALRAAERNPERLSGLILADTQARADSNEAKLKRTAAIIAVKTNGLGAYAEVFMKTAFAKQSFTEKTDAVDAIRRVIESNSAAGITNALVALATRTDTTESLRNIEVPTLILVGEYDELTPPSVSQELHQRIPKSELHVVSRAAHMSNLENAEEFNAYVLNFLSSLD
jgi:3-oxoadipate enol-lactonase